MLFRIFIFLFVFSNLSIAHSTTQRPDLSLLSYVNFDYSQPNKKTITMRHRVSDEFIGSVIFSVDDGIGHIDRIEVSPNYRGLRLGERLFNWAISDLRGQFHAREIRWEAYPFEIPYDRYEVETLQARQTGLDGLINFYQRLGGIVVSWLIIENYRVLAHMELPSGF